MTSMLDMTQAAYVLVGVQITDAMLVSSSVPEPDPAVGEVLWDPATNYAIGAMVARPSTHRVYANRVPGVDAGLPEINPIRWFDAGPTNAWAAYDNYRSTAIKQAGNLTLTLRPGIITAMVFFGLQGDNLHVVCRPSVGGAAYFDATYSLAEYLSGDLMWEFYFGTPRQQDGLRISGLYPQDAQVEITLTPSSITGLAAIGILALGSLEPLGIPQRGFKAQPVDYSRITIDKNGETVIIPGLSAKNITGECIMPVDAAQGVADVIYRLLGKPCAWIISDAAGYDYLNAFGLGRADVTDAGDTHALLSLSVRGLI